MPSLEEIKNLCIRLKNLPDENIYVEDYQGMLEVLNIKYNIENEDNIDIFIDIFSNIKDIINTFEPESQNILGDFYKYYTDEDYTNKLKIRSLQQVHKNWDKIYDKIKDHIMFENLNLSRREMKIMVENFIMVMCNNMGIVDPDLQIIFDEEEYFNDSNETMSRLLEFI